MLHQAISPPYNHMIHSWEPADATARAALTVTPVDKGKIAWQLDNNTFWILLVDDPMEWFQIAAVAAVPPASEISIEDVGDYFTGTNVEAALQELGLAASTPIPEILAFAASDETTALSEGTGKVSLHCPVDMTVHSIFAGVRNGQTSGDILTIDINVAGSSVLSTKLTIDNTEVTSLSAAIPPVISSANWDKGQTITVDIDQCALSTTATGLKIYIEYTRR